MRGRAAPSTAALLIAGIVAVAAYALGGLVSSLLHEGYSFKNQAISS
jgi:hypothetical protein